jgi:AraC-like DNA-binding protein
MSAGSAEAAPLRDRDSVLVCAPHRPSRRGGLAPWQVCRVEAFVDAHLAGGLRIDEAAAVARLSASYFSRAFKATFGVTFCAYALGKRIERAQRLLLTTDDPISSIALACGLADQSHLTRLFSRNVGLPPHAWRRVKRERPSQAA